MAQYRLTKKAIILIIVVFLLIGGGVGGYLFWRLTTDDTVAPTGSDASGGAGACCIPGVGCSAGYVCNADINCTQSENPSPVFLGVVCDPDEDKLGTKSNVITADASATNTGTACGSVVNDKGTTKGTYSKDWKPTTTTLRCPDNSYTCNTVTGKCYKTVVTNGTALDRCRTGFTCTTDFKCTPSVDGSGKTGLGTCQKQINTEPTEGACATYFTSNKTTCEWPKVLMSGTNDSSGNTPQCRCEACSGIDPADAYSCEGNPPTLAQAGQTLGNCPTGYTSCGDSTNHESGSSCTRMASVYAVVNHEDCNNPSYIFRYCKQDVNICENGGILTPSASATYEVGDIVTIKGWAVDADGIDQDKVEVKINGTRVGYATVTNACGTGTTYTDLCTTYGTGVVIWTYSYTVTSAGVLNIAVNWQDTKGNTGDKCAVTRSVTADSEGNPDWSIEKSGSNVCIDETAGSMQAKVSYVITITNTGDAAGQLTELVDTLDSKVEESYIQEDEITPSATVSNNTITWNLDNSYGQFDAGEEKEFTYSIIVPEDAFGQYSNTAVATPDSGDAFSASEVTYATCDDVPDTAIFDSTIFKVALGLVLIGSGVMYISSKNDLFNKLSLNVADGFKYVTSSKDRKNIKKRKFEDKVAGR